MKDKIDSFRHEYEFLSNFYLIDIIFNGEVYKSVEHAYQSAKTLDLSIRKQIQEIDSPGKVKIFSRSINLRPNWDDMRLSIMYNLVNQKFENEHLRDLLINTGDMELIEGNW